jgi:hypothetical protein
MGRISILDKIYKEIKIENSNEHNWLVTYDFPRSKGSPHFYTLFKQLLNKLKTEGTRAQRIQSSIFYTNDLHAAIAATKLAKYYNADVILFKAEETGLLSFSIPDFEFAINEEEVHYVMNAVYHALKKHYSDFQSSEEIDQLCIFLWVNEYHVRPITPINREALGLLLKEFEFLELEGTPHRHSRAPFGLTLENISPVMKSVEDYLQEHKKKGEPTEEIIILYNILWRLVEDDYPPPEVTGKIIIS